ncbi:MAG: CDP-diacylglycerol--glycerol-3-phosphate 3-phosphatidyltransferase [Gammaproteobacteria bacterium]|nr:CDP-diacylglycerol--glycerol-3-phosphate 3-phosphatidyltransferase [Gammaproteobacteria bacterium]
MNIPNTLTLVRIALIPVFILVFYLPYSWADIAASFVFALAALTDWLDGYLARRLGQISRLGAFLDPVADKLMIAVVLVLLVQAHPSPWLALPAAVIVGREITVSALREWMAEVGARGHVAVSIYGKVKTISQMVALFLLLYREPILGIPVFQTGFVLLYVAAVLTLWSMLLYLYAAWPKLSARRARASDA